MKTVLKLLVSAFLLNGFALFSTASAAILSEGRYTCLDESKNTVDDIQVTNLENGLNIDTELISQTVTDDCKRVTTTAANDSEIKVSCDLGAKAIAFYSNFNGLVLYSFTQKDADTINVKTEAAYVEKVEIKTISKQFECIKKKK